MSKPLKHKRRIIELYKAGTPINAIFKATGHTRAAIRNLLKEEKLYIYNSKNNKYKYINNINNNNYPDINNDFKDNKDNIDYTDNIEIDGNTDERPEGLEASQNIKTDILQSAPILEQQVKRIDKIIQRLLKHLDTGDLISTATLRQASEAVSVLTTVKTKIKDLQPNIKPQNQFILNFFNNRDFSKDLKALKDQQIQPLKAIESKEPIPVKAIEIEDIEPATLGNTE